MKREILVLMAIALLSGCASSSTPQSSSVPSAAPSVSAEAVQDKDAAEAYRKITDNLSMPNNCTIGVQRTYTMTFGNDEGKSVYQMDGVLALQDSDTARISQNIWSDGMQSTISGTYENGRLYNTYNDVDYYEDMDAESLKQTMLVPLDFQAVSTEESSVSMQEKDDGSIAFVFELDPSYAGQLLESRYDIYGLGSYDDFSTDHGTIAQTFKDGTLIEEKTDFHATLSEKGIPVDVVCSTSAGYTGIGTTTVSISKQEEEAFASYVNYQDIDTAAISDADIDADEPGATAEETFRRRLLSRLSYTKESDSVYKSEFNEHESYTIDFEHQQFLYSNHSSTYVYNWKGDTGGFGKTCSYDFNNGTYTDGCDASVVDMMQKVKDYFVMELYYCGLSLDDLQGSE